ncbi:uncharacterized protein C6orf226 homolog [Lacerta agilis]|uniref:uncharacterized protein C6orf226 homolog n=1 Tax=Lacerta agilis TaxID=80427 RepID=UPI0014194FC3|nr:uncharacterized protein C6orf226 homolog [Lacerta agilis]
MSSYTNRAQQSCFPPRPPPPATDRIALGTARPPPRCPGGAFRDVRPEWSSPAAGVRLAKGVLLRCASFSLIPKCTLNIRQLVLAAGHQVSIHQTMESTAAGTASSLPSTVEDRKEELQERPADQLQSPDASVSFSEIFRLVQAGQDIPGLQKLNITPTNGSPTPSQMAPRPKPWENNPS